METKSQAHPPPLPSRATDERARWCLSASLALIYVWFGALKIFGLSPAHDLVGNTVFWLPESVFVPALGLWEIAIGIIFLRPRWFARFYWIFFLHMAATTVPLLVLNRVCFSEFPFVPTFVGQYILKNVILISSGWQILAATPRREKPTDQTATVRPFRRQSKPIGHQELRT